MMPRARIVVTELAGAGLLMLILHLVPMVANLPGYNGYSTGIVDAHRFLLAARDSFDRVVLVTSEATSVLTLNRRPELAFPPTGAVPAYIFPFLTGLNGADFRVEAKAQFCAAAPLPRSLVLLPHAVVGDGAAIEESGDRVLMRVKNYGFVFDRSMYPAFIGTNVLRLGGDDLEATDFGEHVFVAADPSVLVLQRLEEDGPSYRFVSRSPKMVLRPADAHFAGDLVLNQDPARDRPYKRIVLQYVHPVHERVITPDPAKGHDIAFDMVNLTSIGVEMDEAAYNPDFKAYVFAVRKPSMRIARALPKSASSAPFSICR